MTRLTRQAAALGALGIAIILAIAWSAGVLSSRRAEAVLTSQQADACERVAEQIQALRQQPAIVGSQAKDMSELVTSIEQSASKAKIPAESLVRVWPQPTRRLAASDFVEMPTQVDLRNVTLRQIIEFLYELSQSESTLTAQRLRLSASPHSQTDSQWAAETTLVYLVYEPPAAKPAAP